MTISTNVKLSHAHVTLNESQCHSDRYQLVESNSSCKESGNLVLFKLQNDMRVITVLPESDRQLVWEL